MSYFHMSIQAMSYAVLFAALPKEEVFHRCTITDIPRLYLECSDRIWEQVVIVKGGGG